MLKIEIRYYILGKTRDTHSVNTKKGLLLSTSTACIIISIKISLGSLSFLLMLWFYEASELVSPLPLGMAVYLYRQTGNPVKQGSC